MRTVDHSSLSPVAVVIVNHNTRELLRDCLGTILPEAPCELIVVDNASCDGSVEMVKSQFPNVSLISNTTNHGYGAAANQAIALCSSKYVLLLNSDIRLQSGALRALGDYLDRTPEAAVVGPRLMRRDSTLQLSCFNFPTPLHVFLDWSNLARLIRYMPFLRDVYLRTWSYAYPRTVPWVLGAALGIRREAFVAVDGFDETFFMYYEEVDLCYRLAKASWQIHFAPVTSLVHLGGESTQQRATEMKVELFRSLVRFYQLHYTPFRLNELLILIRCIAMVGWVRDTVAHLLTQNMYRREKLAAGITAWECLLQNDWRRQARPE